MSKQQLADSFAAQKTAIRRMNDLADEARSKKRTQKRTELLGPDIVATVYAQPKSYVEGVHKPAAEGYGTAGSRKSMRKRNRKTRSRRRR